MVKRGMCVSDIMAQWLGNVSTDRLKFSLYMSDNIMENTFYFIIVCTILTFAKTGAFSGRKLTVRDLKSKITFNGCYLL